MQGKGGISNRRPEVRIILTIWSLGCVLGLLAGGCSSDQANLVGAELVENPISDALETLTIYDLVSYSALGIEDRGQPVPDQEVLYLGHQVTGGDSTSSVILVNYDFGDVYDETFTPEVLTSDNISSVKIQLLMLRHYATLQVDEAKELNAEKVIPKYYELRQLDEPFVEDDYPGPRPANDRLVHWLLPTEHTEGNTVFIPIDKENLLDWLASGEIMGMMIREWEGVGSQTSSPGLLGLSSRDMKHAMSQIDDFNEDISLGPTIEVSLIEPQVTLFIKPIADTSTFHNIAPAPTDPADGLMLRTCLRNYPVLRFDMSGLPANVFINRAILTVVKDATSSFGPAEAIVVSEFIDAVQTPVDILSLVELESRVHQITGMTSLYPSDDLNTDLSFNVTTAIQRFVNGVYEGERGLVLSAGEDFFPNYDLTIVDPDFYFVRFNFFGTAADDDLRPRLEITYSIIDDFQEVGP